MTQRPSSGRLLDERSPASTQRSTPLSEKRALSETVGCEEEQGGEATGECEWNEDPVNDAEFYAA